MLPQTGLYVSASKNIAYGSMNSPRVNAASMTCKHMIIIEHPSLYLDDTHCDDYYYPTVFVGLKYW